MMKPIKLGILGLFAASATFTLIPEASARVKATENEAIFNYHENITLIARRDRRRRRRVRIIRHRRHRGYRRRPRYRTRTYRRCTYKVRYRRGIRHRYRVCNYYRR